MNKKSVFKNFSKRDQYWFWKRVITFIATVIVYLLIGKQLADFVVSLDGIPPITANLIVFGGVGLVISTLRDALDNDKGKFW